MTVWCYIPLTLSPSFGQMGDAAIALLGKPEFYTAALRPVTEHRKEDKEFRTGLRGTE